VGVSFCALYLLMNPCCSGTSSSYSSFSSPAGTVAVSCSRLTSSTTWVASYSVSFLGFPSSVFAFASFSFFIFSSYTLIFYYFYYSTNSAAFLSASLSSTGFARAFVSFAFASLIRSFFCLSSTSLEAILS